MAKVPGKRKVLIAVDHSVHSEMAFDYYVREHYKEGDEIVICHVSELHPPALPHALATEEWKHVVEEHEEKIKRLQEKYKKRCKECKLGGKILLEGAGTSGVGHHIVLAAKKENADLIVTATRGMGVIRRTILGSVSDYILHHATVPIIVVPAKGASPRPSPQPSPVPQRKE
ncbi:predicted protein [Nematostella vectensis]|uniref:UspA domain-containing protein n=2 Tax=Nematostella vectensis TaxID=45351 RepID=A7S1A8_NEMVE|nr:predicted protein [Nematostella vectensis]|eukprot:XP_001634538.1 predicted protein [Nematostella vectensis]